MTAYKQEFLTLKSCYSRGNEQWLIDGRRHAMPPYGLSEESVESAPLLSYEPRMTHEIGAQFDLQRCLPGLLSAADIRRAR
jgi:hypothetical protein